MHSHFPPSARKRAPQPAAVRRSLLGWFARSARELPWRSKRTPYRVWVSEIMLQQTRVEAVIEPYGRFLAAFPTLGALARANEADVVARWSGLGYYRRARMLHRGARFVAGHHRGRIPRTREELERVPGIGAYTAGALLSIAYGLPEIALDANATRVLARVCGIADPRSRAGRSAIEHFAEALVRSARPGDVNESLMDLGSAVCTARIARCEACPLARLCLARRSENPASIGAPRARKTARRVELACAVVSDGERVLFLQRDEGETLLGGMWDLPTVEIGERDDGAGARLRRLVRSRSGLDARLAGPLATVRHEIIGRKIFAKVYVGGIDAADARVRVEGARMLAARDREGVAVPALPVKILRALAHPAAARSLAARAEA